jgi:hypothetical protein
VNPLARIIAEPIGTAPKSIPQPTEAGYYWIAVAEPRWNVSRANEGRVDWTNPLLRWMIVDIDEMGWVWKTGTGVELNWADEYVVKVSARLQAPEAEK